MVANNAESFFPPFSSSIMDKMLNLLINASPPTFIIRSLFLTQPSVAENLGPIADTIIQIQNLPHNLFESDRIPSKTLRTGDRVFSPFRQWPGSNSFGGYILFINGDWAVVQWDFIPIGPLTYDPLQWLEPQI